MLMMIVFILRFNQLNKLYSMKVIKFTIMTGSFIITHESADKLGGAWLCHDRRGIHHIFEFKVELEPRQRMRVHREYGDNSNGK